MPKTTTTRAVTAIDAYIGQRVRLRRQAITLSQTALADEIGVTFQQVQKYEKGTNRIGGGRLAEIAAVLGVGVIYFYEGAPRARGNGPAAEQLSRARKRDQCMASFECVAVIDAMVSMRPPMRQALVNIARALVTTE